MEYCYGIIPLREFKGEWRVLIIRRTEGHWEFPKGHAEPGETHFETAKRELKEETGLDIEKVLVTDPLQERYTYDKEGKEQPKTVVFFLAIVTGKVVLQEEEVISYYWSPIDQAEQVVTYPTAKSLCRKFQTITDSL